MHSFTSNSNRSDARGGLWLLLLALASVVFTLEFAARSLVPRVNWNMRRFHKECGAALSIGCGSGSHQSSLLFLGNSLTLTDIDMQVMESSLGPEIEVRRWAIDDTNYLDWYYGLLRAFRNGARPKWILIGARPGHLMAGHVRGRFFAHYILDAKDVRSAALRTGVDATGFSNMALAQVSSFYGSREEIFKRVLTAALPSFPELGRKMAAKKSGKRL